MGGDVMRLYHFTCRDGARGIQDSGELRPHMHPLLGTAVVWLTDLEAPDRHEIGLTSAILQCDRMERRFVVDCEAQPWADFIRNQPRDVRLAARRLTNFQGVRPMHWWVSTEPVPVVTT